MSFDSIGQRRSMSSTEDACSRGSRFSGGSTASDGATGSDLSAAHDVPAAPAFLAVFVESPNFSAWRGHRDVAAAVRSDVAW